MKRGTIMSQKRVERGTSRDAGSLSEETFPTVLPLLLTMVGGPDRLPVDEDTQEVLRGKLRLLQADSTEVTALFMEVASHLLSISHEENIIFVTFKTFEEIWKFTTYYTLGFLDQCMESLLFDQKFWIASLDRDNLSIEVSVPGDTLHLMYKGLLMQEGSFFASCSANQIFDSSTSGGDLYLEQGDIAQFEPPFLGSGWSVLSLSDGARGTKLKPALEPVEHFYQWFLKSCSENILVGSGKPVCHFPSLFAQGTCLAKVEYQAEGPDELDMAPGDRISIVGLLVSCFDWFIGRKDATGDVGLVKTTLVQPADNLCEAADIFLDKEERSFFCLEEERIIQETTALLKKTSQNDVGYVYKLDLISQKHSEKPATQSDSFCKGDTDTRLELKRNIERILVPGQMASYHSNGITTESEGDTVASPTASHQEMPCFTVHPVVEGSNNAEIFSAFLSFLEGCDYRREFDVLYGETTQLLSSSTFSGYSDEDELTAFLSAARETARKRRLYWSQSRVCFLLGKLCARRSKFSQARVYLEESLSVPREGFTDMRLLSTIYASLAVIYLLQKNVEKYFAIAERLTALTMAIPECIASVKDYAEVLKFTLKKAILSQNKMAEARTCFVLAKCYLARDEDSSALPYIERLLVLSVEGSCNVSPSNVYLSLGRLYSKLSLPHLSVYSSRSATLQSAATLSDCLGGLALVLENSAKLFWLRHQDVSLPSQSMSYLRQALSLVEECAQENEDRRHALSHTLTLCLSRLFQKHGKDGLAIDAVRAFVNRTHRATRLPLSERRGTLIWLGWLYICNKQADMAVEVLNAILASMPEHCTTPQEGLVLNMRGIALRCKGDLRRAAESYQAASDICEEFEDIPNWALAQANLGLLCLTAGAKTLAERHLTKAVELFSTLEEEGRELNFSSVLLELGRHYVTQGQMHYGKGCYEWALLLAIKADQWDCQLRATQHLCHLYGTVSPNQAQCIIYNQHQLHLLANRGDTRREGDILQTISELYLSLGTEKAYWAALDYTKRGLGIFIDLSDREKEAYGWLQAGKIYHMLGQTELVDLYIQVAQDVGLITGDTSFILRLLEAAGDVFFNSSQDREKAVCFYRDRALPIALKTDSATTKLRLCNKLVELLLSLKLYKNAVEFAQTSLDISITLGERLNERVSYHRLASIYHQLGQFELAEHHYLKALSLCPAPLQFDEETLYYARVYQTLGDIIFYDLKDPHDAAGYYQLALAAAMDLGNKRAQLQLCTRLATIYHNFLVDRELSLFFYQKARGFASELNVRRVNISAPQQPGSAAQRTVPQRTSHRMATQSTTSQQ